MEKKKEFYKTNEYYLAVTLTLKKEELINVEKIDSSNRAFFIFEKSSTLEKNIEDFRKGKILVEPQSLFVQHKILKSRLYNNY